MVKNSITFNLNKYLFISIHLSLLIATINISKNYAQAKLELVPKPGLAFSSVIKLENIDTSVYAEWVDGKETRINTSESKQKRPEWILWTDKTEVGNSSFSYGVSKTISPRHLRFGFYQPINIGSIITEGGGRPSVLKTGIPYPGNLNDESEWIAAQRLIKGQISNREALSNEYAIWIFPQGTQTTAIRFSHYPTILDENDAGTISGALVIDQRLSNIAPLAQLKSKSNTQKNNLLTNEIDENWNAWDNRSLQDKPDSTTPTITEQNSEWISLLWQHQIKLNGLAAISAGFSTSEVQYYMGNPNKKPDINNITEWRTIKVYDGVMALLGKFWPNILNFGQTITTTALKIKITSAIKNSGYLQTRSQGGKRIWLGEIMALQLLGNSPLQSATILPKEVALKPLIAVPFTLKKAGYVTLVIEDSNGIRVRNLISDTWFKAGRDTAWWDGLDDLGRDPNAANHGIYHIPAKFVTIGKYKVHGIVHGEINTNFEFPIYTAGNPPWGTADHTGGWLANHTAPQAALYVPSNHSPTNEPAVILGSYVTEGPDGIAWVDLDGKKKGGEKWVGGIWTGAPFLARDESDSAAKDVFAYVASIWDAGNNTSLEELRINAISPNGDKKIIQKTIGIYSKTDDITKEIGGFAVNNNAGVISRPSKNQLLFIDFKAAKIIDSLSITNPHGLAYDNQGRLLVTSDNKLLRLKHNRTEKPETVISSNLDEPIAITLDSSGNFYISDRGNSHQVKVFSPKGKFILSIGNPGKPQAGNYDSLHMNNPAGLTIDSRQHLWVAENDFLPKRVSVWTIDGKFIKAFYGPSKYGGGGTLDGHDKNKFYYADGEGGAMEFELDWKTGLDKLKNVYYRKSNETIPLAFRSAAPETVLYYDGRRYFTNCYNSNPTNGHSTAFLFIDKNGIAIPIAAMGRTSDWNLLSQDSFKSCYPIDTSSIKSKQKTQTFFIWTDLNEDGQVQPQEVTIQIGSTGGVTIMEDLSFCLPVDGKALQFSPTNFSKHGTPFYSINKQKLLATGVQLPPSSGGGQILTFTDGWTIATNGIVPFDQYSICGAKDGKTIWSYPNVWPGLHPSHHAPLPEFSGELIGPTRLLGGLLNFKDSKSGPLWAINSNHGMVYIFTYDGLFVTTLFKPMRIGKQIKMPVALREMNLNDMTLNEENFWPSITQTEDGNVYLVDGSRTSLIKVDGLKDIQRLPEISINLSNNDLKKCRNYQINVESQRQNHDCNVALNVMISTKNKIVDGKLDDWKNNQWVDIDNSGIYNGKMFTKGIIVQGAVSINDNKLYLAYKTGDPQLLRNSGEMPIAPFKTGGALDLMLSTNPKADKNRRSPSDGDIRLLVTLVKGKPKALIYRAKVAGTKDADKVPYSSPWRTITFDKVEDVSSQLVFAESKDGNYEYSIPLSVLNIKPINGLELKGDIGILRGDGTQTISRVYWNNKATAIVSDVPSEAELTPSLWGTFKFVDE